MEQLQSHIWLTASSYMGNIFAFPHMLGSPPHIWPCNWGKFDFLFYQCKLLYLFWQKLVFTLQIGDHFFLIPNSERGSITPCAVKSSFTTGLQKSLYRDYTYRLPYLLWQKLAFTLQIGDHFFLSPNSERSSLMPCAVKSSFKGAQAWDIRSLGFSWFLHHKVSTCGRLLG